MRCLPQVLRKLAAFITSVASISVLFRMIGHMHVGPKAANQIASNVIPKDEITRADDSTTTHLSEYQWKLISCAGFNLSVIKDMGIEDVHRHLQLPRLAFLPSYKNPCTENPAESVASSIDDHRLPPIRCLPYVYVPGQAKCGTSDMYGALGLHPNVTLPSVKEPWWWNRKRLGYHGYAVKTTGWQSLSDYLDVFEGPSKEIQSTVSDGYHPLITGDISAIYLSWEEAWPLYPGNEGLDEPRFTLPHFIRRLTPDVKVIISLRNPVDRLYSHYFEQAKQRKYIVLSPEGFHESAVESLRLMNECLKNNSLRHCLYDNCLNDIQRMRVPLRHSIYHVYVLDWLKEFPRDQVLFVKFEEYAADRIAVLTNIFNFLEAGPLSNSYLEKLKSLDVKNKRWSLHQVGPMLEKTRRLLSDFYTPFNRQLADILQDKRFLYET